MKLLLLSAQGASEWIAIQDICMIVPSPQGPLFTKRDGGVYRYPHTMDQLVRLFGSYGFDRLDRNVVANLEAVERYDPELRKVYFGPVPQGENSQDELYATVSTSNAAKVKHLTVRECGELYEAHEAA